MIICDNSFKVFVSQTEKKQLIAFGASDFLRFIARNYEDLQLHNKLKYIVDNDISKQGEMFCLEDKKIPVCTPELLLDENINDIVILITSSAYAWEIYNQLEQFECLKSVPCFFLMNMIAERSDCINDDLFNLSSEKEVHIPKIIHCFWFSGDKKDALSQKCLDSWRRNCPDYEIKEWNADNYDVTKNIYMKKAFEMRKWAFVADYARLDMLYEYGGFYFDLDIELYSNLDVLRCHDFVIGFGPYRDVEGAAFGASQEFWLTKKLLNIYEGREFDWNKVLSGEIQPMYLNQEFKKIGFIMNGEYQERNGIAIYPKEVFSDRNPFNEQINRTDMALGVHHCAGGWWGRKNIVEHEKCRNSFEKICELYKEL